MGKTLNVLPVLAALAVALPAPSASAAPLRTLHAGQVSATARLVGQADATTIAYRSGVRFDAPLILRGDDRSIRTAVAPAGCILSAAGSGLLAGACDGESYDPIRHLVVTRLDGTVVTRLDARSHDDAANGYSAGDPIEVGSQWIRASNSAKDAGNWWQDVNWHTGEVRQSYEDDARQVDDLDAAELGVPLCAPLRRISAGDGSPEHYAVAVDGPWAIVEGPGPTQNESTFTLRHCGLARPVVLPARFAPTALGHGWVAGVTTIAHRPPRLDLLRLADRRRFAISGVSPSTRAPMFTRGRLYAADDRGLFTVRLPSL